MTSSFLVAEANMSIDRNLLDRASERWAKLAAQARFSRLSRSMFGIEVEPPRVGRFELETLYGTGGMAAVFAARDPQLDRRVAVKLLTIPPHPTLTLLAEAKTLARLSHPNIVTVHEVGLEGEDLFLVMELIDGGPLSRLWAKETSPLQVLLRAFAQAGEGLAAVHKAGIVHCDLKPGNVLITLDGRVKVADFGLARLMDGPVVATATPLSPGNGERSSTVSRRGTPAYMAPEQRAGMRPNALSDQFSFCVCLWEALHGCRPFEAESTSPRRTRMVPRWLDRTLLRGLAAEPSARWSTMQELVDVLQAAPERRRRRLAAAVVVAIPLVAGVGPWVCTPRCPERRADLEGAWGRARADAIAKVWQAGPRFQRESWSWIRTELDRWADAWIDVQQRACRATFHDRTRSDAAYDLTMACLERRRVALGSTTDLLASGTSEIAAAATQMLEALDPPSTCLDGADRMSVAPTPESITAGERVDRARLFVALGDTSAALEALGAATPELPEDHPIVAEHHLATGAALSVIGRWDEADRALTLAAQAALEGQHDMIAADAFLGLAELEVERQQHVEAQRWLDLAAAQQKRVDADARRRARLLDVIGQLSVRQGRPADAEATYRAALELLTGTEASDPLVFTARRHLAVSLAEQGRFSAAEAVFVELADEIGVSLGRQHPDLGTIEKNLAIDAKDQGSLDVALTHAQRAHALLVGAFGEGSIRIAPTLTLMADLWNSLGAPETAVSLAAEAWRLQKKHLPIGHSERGTALALLAWLQLHAGDFEAALPSFLELEREFHHGPNSHMLPSISQDIGIALLGVGRWREAHERFTALERQLPADDALIPYVASGLALAELDLGNPARAEELAKATLMGVLAAGEVDADLRAELRMVLAACRLAAGDRRNAVALAREAAADAPSVYVRKLFSAKVIALLDGAADHRR